MVSIMRVKGMLVTLETISGLRLSGWGGGDGD